MLRVRTFRKVYLAFLTIIALLVTGVLGFMVLEELTLIDALYMTVITVSTVGFGEVTPLSVEGRIFTIFLIISSITAFAYAVALVTSHIAEGNFVREVRAKNLRKQLTKMNNHVIICGYGRVGKGAALDLEMNHIPHVIIDRNQELEVGFKDKEALFITGDASREEILNLAGIDKARALITCLPSDSDNLYVVLSARELNKDLCVIARASRHDAVSKLKFAGATNVIMPDTVGGNQMAALVTNPDLMEFLDVIRYEGNQGINVKSILAAELSQVFVGKKVKEVNRESISNCQLIGIKTAGGNYIVNPEGDTLLEADTRLFLLGGQAQIEGLERRLQKT